MLPFVDVRGQLFDDCRRRSDVVTLPDEDVCRFLKNRMLEKTVKVAMP